MHHIKHIHGLLSTISLNSTLLLHVQCVTWLVVSVSTTVLVVDTGSVRRPSQLVLRVLVVVLV